MRDTRRIVRPEPGQFELPGVKQGGLGTDGTESSNEKRVDLKREFGDRGLQIIVKLSSIHLTPENPSYGGGTWHVEGQLVRVHQISFLAAAHHLFPIWQNEHICATAIYYYDSANITESRLSFRQQSKNDLMDISYPLNDHDWLQEIFGCEQNGPSVQYVGDVVAKEGRLLTFPNVFQHRVLPFQLLDKSKVGHRKILALFLVDPHLRVISSANVPCQQREWWAQEIAERGLFRAFPGEIQEEVILNVEEFPMGIETAEELRLELMEERKAFVKMQDETFMSYTFALCEH